MFQRTAFCGALLIALPATVSAQQSETPPGRLQLPPVTVITPKKAEPAKPKAKAGPKKTGPAAASKRRGGRASRRVSRRHRRGTCWGCE